MKYAKPFINEIRPYKPGKPIDEVKRELGLDEVVKLASNENPFGVSEKVKTALAAKLDELTIYPDGASFELRSKLAEYHGVDMDEIVLGNGSNEIIEFIGRGFVDHGDEVVSSQYAFLVYPLLTKVCDGKYIQVPAKDYAYDLDAIAEAITDKTKVVFLANPNNPTGTYFTKSEFESFLEKVPEDVIIALDEAYIDFADVDDFPDGKDYFRKRNIVVLRTFSKAYGLAGLRIGYAIANKELVTYFNKIRQPFNTNLLAQAAACAVLEDKEYYEKTLRLTKEGKEYLYSEFSKMELSYIKSLTNFVLVDVEMDSKEFFEACLRQGVVLRDMKAYGLDTHVRITVGSSIENKKVIDAIKTVLGK